MLGLSPMHIKYSSYVYDGFCIWRTNFPGPIESVISKFTCSEDLAIASVSNFDLSGTLLGDKDQLGLLYCLHYRENCAATCAESNFWAIRSSLAGFISTCFYSSKHKVHAKFVAKQIRHVKKTWKTVVKYIHWIKSTTNSTFCIKRKPCQALT